MERLFDKITFEPNTGCWLWSASRSQNGYGYFGVNGKIKKAHRVVYEMVKGKIPDGLVLDHLCRTPSCVNPDHLDPVTFLENVRRGRVSIVKRTTVCPKGHDITKKENIYPVTRIVNGHTRKSKTCATCDRDRKRARYANTSNK